MNLQDLNDAVGYLDASQRRGDCQTWGLEPMRTVARRVAALYDTCPDCAGTGEVWIEEDDRGVRMECPECDYGGTPSQTFRQIADTVDGWKAHWRDLAHYLFGDAT